MEQIIFKPLEMNDTYVFDYEKTKKQPPSYKGNFSKVNLDYLDGIYGDKNIYSTPRDLLKFDMGEIEFFPGNFCKKPSLDTVTNIKEKKL
jgi:hypothetical protein